MIASPRSASAAHLDAGPWTAEHGPVWAAAGALAIGIAFGYSWVENTIAITPLALCAALGKVPGVAKVFLTNLLAAAFLGAAARLLLVLPMLLLFGYGIRVGAQIASAQQHGVPLVVSAGILGPHGAFELTAFMLAVSLGAAYRRGPVPGWRRHGTVIIALLLVGAATEMTVSRWFGAYLFRRTGTLACLP